ncbi:MAG: hypothetical protein ACHREM_00890 [Polyangiales bacterium]
MKHTTFSQMAVERFTRAADWARKGRELYACGAFTYNDVTTGADDAATAQRVSALLYTEACAYRDEASLDEPEGLDEFVESYTIAALWTGVDDKDVPLDTNYDETDVQPTKAAEMRLDCSRFLREHAADIGDNYAQAGHDFWLTRNGHGVGFSDRKDYDGQEGGPIAMRLHEAAQAWGETYITESDLVVADGAEIAEGGDALEA